MTAWNEERYFLASDGVRLHYKDAEGDGEPVIFVHGYTASIGGQWGRPGLIAGIREAGWRTIAFDLRGHGKSNKPHCVADYAGERMGLDALELMDHLGIQRAHIVGYSLGSHIMMHTLVSHPERAATYTIGGAAGRWNWTDEETIAVNEEADELQTGAITKHILRLWPVNKPKPSAAELWELSRKKMDGMDHLSMAAIKRIMPDHLVTREQVQALSMPLLGVVGTNDPQLEPFRELSGFHLQIELVEIQGAGHGDCPGKPEFLSALSVFLKKNEGLTV